MSSRVQISVTIIDGIFFFPSATPSPTPGGGSVLNTETLTIITATTGSILGILVVTVILTGRQCRSRHHRHHTSRNYPPVLRARLARLHRDSDRTALFAVTDNINVVLPSYDEAVATIQTSSSPTQSSPNSNGEPAQSDDGQNSTVVQGRPLPPLPPPNQNTSSRSGRARHRRSSANSQQEPLLPPPYEDDEEPLDITELVSEVSTQEGRGQDRGSRGATGGDLYAEVPLRRPDGQGEGAQSNNNNNTQEDVQIGETSS